MRKALARVAAAALLAGAGGCVWLAVEWYQAKQDENADVQCSLRAQSAPYEVRKGHGGYACIFRDRLGRLTTTSVSGG
jgi:hypothetical protein